MVAIQWYAPVNLYSPQIKKKEMKKVGAWTFANYNGNSIKFCQSQNMTKQQSKNAIFLTNFPLFNAITMLIPAKSYQDKL